MCYYWMNSPKLISSISTISIWTDAVAKLLLFMTTNRIVVRLFAPRPGQFSDVYIGIRTHNQCDLICFENYITSASQWKYIRDHNSNNRFIGISTANSIPRQSQHRKNRVFCVTRVYRETWFSTFNSWYPRYMYASAEVCIGVVESGMGS